MTLKACSVVCQLASAQLPPSALRTPPPARCSTPPHTGWKHRCAVNNMPAAPVHSQSDHVPVFSNESVVEWCCDVISPGLWMRVDLPTPVLLQDTLGLSWFSHAICHHLTTTRQTPICDIMIIGVQRSVYNVYIFLHRFKVRFFFSVP